jgi:hypothetical protein
MKRLVDLTIAAAFAMTVSSAAHANDARCSKPPYGGSPDRYRAILEAYHHKPESVAKALEDVCNMKFSGADRAPLHKLGFTDAEINSADTATLAIDTMNGVKGRPVAK